MIFTELNDFDINVLTIFLFKNQNIICFYLSAEWTDSGYSKVTLFELFVLVNFVDLRIVLFEYSVFSYFAWLNTFFLSFN